MSVKGFREVFARINKANFKTIGKIFAVTIITGLIIIALVGVFSSLCIYVYKFVASIYKIGIGDRYELLRDLLTVVLGIAVVGISVVGLLVYRILRERLEKKAALAAKTEMTRSSAFLLNYVGYVYWRDYDAGKRTQYEYLSRAIELTESAYCDYASELSERENELLICEIKNNLAYYLTERQNFPEHAKPEDKRIAQEFATYVYRRLSKFPTRKADWWKTYDFVVKKFKLSEKDLQN